MNALRIAAHDRRMAAVHEAGHAVVAMHVGVGVWGAHIRPNPTGDILLEKSYVGQVSFAAPSDLGHGRLIGVAGMVAEEIWKARDPDYQDWLDYMSDPDCMSPTDWAAKGCEPGEPEDELIEAAEMVENLLGGELLPKLTTLSRRLIEAESRGTEEAVLNVMAQLGYTVNVASDNARPWRAAA